MNAQSLKEIVQYHEKSKHHYNRYAKSLGYMDWKNQPNPFRFYQESPVVALPLLKEDPQAGYPDLYERKNNKPRSFNTGNLAGFLELSLGLSAWKALSGSRWSLRINPSSGNLHPTEAHLILPQMDSVASGVYHYNALTHSLEKRVSIPDKLWQNIVAHFGTNGFLIGISSIFWRESWKYGERAFRYCNHDAGHALACISFSANLFGWQATYLNGVSDEDIEAVLGFGQTSFHKLEGEHPDFLCFIHSNPINETSRSLPDKIVSQFSKLTFVGKPEMLSQKCINWEIIYRTAHFARKPTTKARKYDYGYRNWISKDQGQFSASDIIRKRRSATSFNREGSVTRNQFLTMLDKTIPRNNCAPFDVELMEPSTHLLIFVHNVKNMAPGLYFFFRLENHLDEIRRNADSDFLWEPIEKDFPLFLLKKGNYRQDAMMVSCHQEIAGFSIFSLGMIAKFKKLIAKEPYRYRHLFWETGMIGQVLYLEAEAHGVRGTGIGCFFDDAVHEIMGFKDNQYQSLYHFTIGEPVEDPRLTTYAPYYHLKTR